MGRKRWGGDGEELEEKKVKEEEEEGGKKEGRCHPQESVHSCVFRFFPKAHKLQCRRNS